MSIYKVIETKNSVKYWKDNRFVKKDDVPEAIIEALKLEPTIDDQNLPEVLIDKSCVFCGLHAKYSRRINNQTVYICELDYYDKTTGQILAQFNAKKLEQERQLA